MSQQGAALQSFNNELVKCVEDLRQKREDLSKQIDQETRDKEAIEEEVRNLTDKLAKVNENLAKKMRVRGELDEAIAETEQAYRKILETSQTLLNSVRGTINRTQKNTS